MYTASLSSYPMISKQSKLSLARFGEYNTAYCWGNESTCASCNGVGGHTSQELQGDEHMTGWVSFFEACPDCICAEKCPGCLQPLSLSFDQSAFPSGFVVVNPGTNYHYSLRLFDYDAALSGMPFVGFTCLVCGWQFDLDRENDAANDYYEDYYDEVQPNTHDPLWEGYPGTGGFY